MSKLQHLDPLKPLDKTLVLKTPIRNKDVNHSDLDHSNTKQNDLFTPINVFGTSNLSTATEKIIPLAIPEPPNLKNRSPKTHSVLDPRDVVPGRSLKTLRLLNSEGSEEHKDLKQSRRMNPLYYKTRDVHASYNSLMNKLYPGSNSSEDMIAPNIPAVSTETVIVQDNKVVLGSEGSRKLRFLGLPPGTESLESEGSQNNKVVLESNGDIISEDPINFSDKIEKYKPVNENKTSNSLQTYLDSLEVIDKIRELETLVQPKNCDLEEFANIEVIDDPNLTKKKCVVWWEGETIPYNKFRQNPDNVIFIVGEDAYGYSKAALYNEYQETIKKKIIDKRDSRSSVSNRSIYFDLNLNWEDNETLWIPMNQVLKVLEYSHPVYEIQKMKYSIHVWNLVPVKLK